ncbi:MAG: hypothetical protein FWG60_03410 [Methanomassiliicoccaceae archaeon]|nr:hypothetical protein [Methanomassiliicoccaceae archaeon]
MRGAKRVINWSILFGIFHRYSFAASKCGIVSVSTKNYFAHVSSGAFLLIRIKKHSASGTGASDLAAGSAGGPQKTIPADRDGIYAVPKEDVIGKITIEHR